MDITKRGIENAQEQIARDQEALKNLEELKAALQKHTGKLVDKRFFEEHFSVSNEFRTYTKYSIKPKAYEWLKHSHEIYIPRFERLELMNRETKHILEEIEKHIEIIQGRISKYQEEVSKLSQIDEQVIIEEIQAIYFKYNAPSVWTEILDSWRVKYPKEEHNS